MQKLYMNYPEISEISANIISRRTNGDKTQIILDRTIFMPRKEYLLEDSGYISDLEVLSVEEKKDNIIHTVKGKFQKSAVSLKLNDKNRMKNLIYNTAYIIFKLVLQTFYHVEDIELKLIDDNFYIIVSDFYDILDQELIEDQINFIISKAIKIDNKNGITSIYPFGEVINNDICFDNTGKVMGFKIKKIEQINDDIKIEFLAALDILK